MLRMAERGDEGPESEHHPPRSTRGVSRWHTRCSTGTCTRSWRIPRSPAQDQCSPFAAKGGSTSSAASGLASRRRRYVSGDDESAAAECVRQAQGKGVRAVRTTHHEQRRHRCEERWPGPLDLARLETSSRYSSSLLTLDGLGLAGSDVTMLAIGRCVSRQREAWTWMRLLVDCLPPGLLAWVWTGWRATS